MLEIRIHGRGGQGNVVAAYLLAGAAFAAGRACQAFPAFGAERRGAPVTAFVRIADAPIKRRSQVRTPGFLIVQDDALLHAAGTLSGLKPGGGVLVNTAESADALTARLGVPALAIPGTALALEALGKPVPNVALLGAFLAATGLLPPEALETALAQRFKGAVLDHNRALAAHAAGLVPAGIWAAAVSSTNEEIGHAACA